MIELAFLMPIYMLMFFAAYYFGDIVRIKFSAAESTYYYSQKEGIETPEDAESLFFARYGADGGSMNEFNDTEAELENISEGYIYDSLNTAAYDAQTYYAIDDQGQMVPVTEDYYVLPINFGVFDQARNSSYVIADSLDDWYYHGDSSVDYKYSPYYLRLQNVGMEEFETNITKDFYGAYKDSAYARNLEGDPEPILDYLNTFEPNGSLEMPAPEDQSKPEYWISR